MAEPTLRELEEWLCGYLVRPGNDRAVEAMAAADIERLTGGADGLRIYRQQYRMRMVGALRDDFPRLAAVMGETDFARLALAYVAAHPSSFYNISRLRDGLPAFIEKGFLFDLARVELAILQCGDAPGEPAAQLLSLAYPIDVFLRSESARVEDFPRRQSWVVVYRREFEVWRLPLTRREHAVLRLLLSGQDMEAVLSKTCDARSLEGMRTKIGEWRSSGLLAG